MLSDLQDFLNRSLADRQFSGNEKSALKDWLATNVRSNQQLGVVRHAIFDAVRAAASVQETIQLIDWLEEAMKVVAPIDPQPAALGPQTRIESDVVFSPGNSCLDRIVHRLRNARRSIQICVFTITDDRITRSILDAHHRGVAIQIITDNDKVDDTGSDIRELEAAGIPTKIDMTPAHMHHKFAIFDGTRVLNGSYNWTRSAAEVNEENIIDSNDPNLVAAFTAEFKKLWNAL